MTVYALMPVFNRIAMTKNMLDCLRGQKLAQKLSMVVIDDGSEDGTSDFLRTQPDVTVLKGSGSLWWGGAIDLGLRYLFSIANDDDWVLFVNNDTHIESDYVQELVNFAKSHHPCVVGSFLRDINSSLTLLSVAPKINAWQFTVKDVVSVQSNFAQHQSKLLVDALSGRGVIFPITALRAVGGMRKKWLPHYLADYELSLRVRKSGWDLWAVDVPVYSENQFGNASIPSSLYQKWTSIRSPAYLPAQLAFWWSASNLLQKITLPIRLITFMLFPFLRKI